MVISYAEAFLRICFSNGSIYTTKVTATRYRYQYLYAPVQLPSDVWSTVAETEWHAHAFLNDHNARPNRTITTMSTDSDKFRTLLLWSYSVEHADC